MDQKFFEWMNAFSRKKLLKHSHGVTQATYTVTQERDKRRYNSIFAILVPLSNKRPDIYLF